MELIQSQQKKPATPPHIIVHPSPGVGHLTPLVELAKRLASQHHFSVTITVPSNTCPSATELAILKSLPKPITPILFSPVNSDHLPADADVETRIFETMARSIPSLRDAFFSITSTGTRVAALVVDIFGTDAFAVANEFHALPFIFHPSTATCLSLFLHLPELDRVHSCEYRDLTESVKLPGCTPFRGTELVDPMQDRKNQSYKWLLHMARGYLSAKGILVNSFHGLEPGPIKALMDDPDMPPVYPVGPIIQIGSSSTHDDGSESSCLKWLDEQPGGSVLYVSFGSGGTLSYEQIVELAFGLELSGQRFLWVLRSPNDRIANASFFGDEQSNINNPLSFLPKGFLERTKDLGLVVASWAPQIRVLNHGSTGGFLTHCGWNSTLESVCKGVPLIAWPLYAEQRMNARMLEDEAKVALRPKAGENGVVGRDEIARVVKGLMEGEEGTRVSNRMREIQSEAAMVLREDGSSSKALSEVASLWKNHNASRFQM